MTISKPESRGQDDLAAKRKHFTRSKFVWIDQAMRDKSLLSSAKVVVYVISQHLNIKSGEAFPSTETIAEWGGLAPSCVRKALKALADSGHLAVKWGKRGRGHPNRYKMIIKPGSHEISAAKRGWRSSTEFDCENKPLKCPVLGDGDKPQSGTVLEIVKPPNEDLKPHVQHPKTAQVCHEPIITKLKKVRGAASPPPLVDTVDVTPCNASQTSENNREADIPANGLTANAGHDDLETSKREQFLLLCCVQDLHRDKVIEAYSLAVKAGYSPDDLFKLWDSEGFDDPEFWLLELAGCLSDEGDLPIAPDAEPLQNAWCSADGVTPGVDGTPWDNDADDHDESAAARGAMFTLGNQIPARSASTLTARVVVGERAAEGVNIGR